MLVLRSLVTMPELPEVERARRLLEDYGGAKKIVRCNTNEQGGGPRDGKLDDIVFEGEGSAKAFPSVIVGRCIVAVKRRGKQLWCELSGDGHHPLFHFGMTGSFSVKGVDAPQYKSFTVSGEWPPRFCKCELELEGGVCIAFSDPRRLGRILLRANPLQEKPVSLLAPDPVLEPPTVDEFKAKVRVRDKPIKAVLLDQNMVLSGIGNWIADEVLYQAGVHPSTKCSAMSEAQLDAVFCKVLEVCSFACEVNADSDSFPKEWLFHYRWGKGGAETKMPDGSQIIFETVAGRTSAIVPSRQKRGAQAAPKKQGRAPPGEGEASLKKGEPKKEAQPRKSRKRKAAGMQVAATDDDAAIARRMQEEEDETVV